MVKLETKTKKDVTLMNELKDGQIAVVLYNKSFPHYEGKIVQMYKNFGISIGEASGKGWTSVQYNTLKVRILKEGEILTIFDNK